MVNSFITYYNPRRVENVSVLSDGTEKVVAGEMLALIGGKGEFVSIVDTWLDHLR